MALKGSPVLAETLADLLAEIGMIFQNEDVFAMAPLDEVQVLAPMDGGAWTVIMSFRLIWGGSPVTAAAEEKIKAWIFVNPATNVVSIESFEAYIKNHELMVAAQRGHRLTMVKSISMSSLQIITKRTKVDEPPSSLWGNLIASAIEKLEFLGASPAEQTAENAHTCSEMRRFASTCVARKAPLSMLSFISGLMEFEFAEKGLYAACVLAREPGFARIEATVCVLVSIDKSSERSSTTPVTIYLEAAGEKLTGDADFTIDIVITICNHASTKLGACSWAYNDKMGQ